MELREEKKTAELVSKGGELKPLLIIAGPTAVGKTAVSVEIARRLSGECISADSIQVYRGLDIGSAKASLEERRGVPHHLIDVLEPDEHYDAVRFQKMSQEAIEGIYKRGRLPILVGGTGFYIQALIYGVDFSEEPDERQELIRERLYRESLETGGAERLYQRLERLDPVSAERIHRNNIRRVLRALEYYELHGSVISQHNDEQKRAAPVYDAAFFVLTDDRARLYERIDRRVDSMMDCGFLSEVQRLYSSGLRSTDSVMQGIGYRELLRYLEGDLSLDDAVLLIKKNSRNYAKRQLTWFRREKAACWVDISKLNYEKDKISEWIIEKCIEKWA